VNDFQKELTGSRIEDENRTVDWFRRQVSFERLMNRDSVNVRVIDEPNALV
jgi:hypothetical protein